MRGLARLPIDEALPDVLAALRTHGCAVVVAPPGAGKTTRVPPAIAHAGIIGEKLAVVMLQPRRVAARAAAARIAAERGWTIGREVGWHIRFDNRTSRETRVRVLTEGILTRQLIADPGLDGIGCVVLDEFHERNLHTDLALGLLHEIRESLRPDLRIVVMSATMDPRPVAAFLNDAPVVESPGRMHAVAIEFAPSLFSRERPAEHTARVLNDALAQPPAASGHVLVFLPGIGEIRRVEERIARDTGTVHILHSSVSAEEQDRALAPSDGRKIVLATNIAETSLTIDGVRTVIDSGLARVPVHDARLGIDRLETRRISRASANQRAGRAGRTAPGRCLRCWSAAEDAGLVDAEEPEVRRLDLAGTLLALKAWGVADADAFGWFEKPGTESVERAEQLLAMLGATDGTGRLTALGRVLARLPLHPRLGVLLVHGARAGVPREAAAVAAWLSEGMPPREAARHHDGASDVLEWLEDFESGGGGPAARSIARVCDDLLRLSGREGLTALKNDGTREERLLRVFVRAWPDRVTRRRENGSPRGVMVGRRGVVLEESSTVRRGAFFLSLDPRDVPGSGESRVRLASIVRREWLAHDHPTLAREETTYTFNDAKQKVEASRCFLFADLELEAKSLGTLPDRAAASRVLREALAPRAAKLFADDDTAASFLRRVRFLRNAMPELDLPSFDEDGLRAIVEEACEGCVSLADVERGGLVSLLRARLSWRGQQALDQHAPEALPVPSGNRKRLEYDADPTRPPVLAVRLQEMFGLAQTPRIAGGRVAVLLHLLAPSQRPVQVTQDLAGFWARTYPEVRKELRARYPRHSWPDDPLTAPATARAKRRE
ncbi:MAG: ATP-dependent helicase HrpB [Candidatus Sumerlaeota bacterium]|nr:ATP-dependent helicase HrpB [Candidatus Sumerlaeota bacterium]